jgi:diguanylate cyclase (GGDEF)-like protein/PAS domain S-box-containing protein
MAETPDKPIGEESKIGTGWLPLLVGILLSILTLALWKTLDLQEETTIRNKVKTETDYLASLIEADLRNRIPELQRIVHIFELHRGMPDNEIKNYAQSYIADTPGFQAVEWVDRNYLVRWIIPLEGNEKAFNLNLTFEKTRRIAMDKSRDTRLPTMTTPVNLVQSGTGILAFFPVYVDGEFRGCVIAVFRIQEWLDYVFNIKNPKTMAEDYKVSVLFDNITIYRQTGWDKLKDDEFSLPSIAKIMDHNLYVNVRPTKTFIQKTETQLPELTAIFGILLALLVSFIVHLYQKAHMKAWQTHVAKQLVEKEIRERARIQEELNHTLIRIDLATKAGLMGVWTWDISSDILTWNNRMFDLYDLPSDIIPTYDTWKNAIHPDDREHAETLLQKAVLGKAVFDTEFRIVLSDGSARNIRAAARVERDDKDKPAYVTGLNWDITANRQAEEALRKSEEQVRLLLNSTGEAIYGINLEGNCTFANSSCVRILGYPDMESLIGKNMHQLIHHSYPNGHPMHNKDCRIYKAFREGKGEHVVDEVLWKADGTNFPAEYWSYPQINNGKITGAVVTFVDITVRRTTEELLATERRRLSDILEGTHVGIWEWNVQTGKIVLNERWAEIIGYSLLELEPITIDTWIQYSHPEDLIISNELLEKHFKHELPYYECEVRMRHKNGNWIWVLDRGKVATWTEDGKPLLMSGTHQDITARKETEAKILHMATHDGLTDLPSLRLARDRLSMAMSMARRYNTSIAVMFIDLDGFKAINDTYGHDAGDCVLQETAQRLRSCLREIDTIARIGGDEFLIVLTELKDVNNTSTIAENILRLLSQTFIVNGIQTSISASIGIALFPDDGDNIDILIKRADETMYKVKSTGKNGYRLAEKETDS